MLNSQHAEMPYFSYQDSRKWLSGVSKDIAVRFCLAETVSPSFRGRAVCVQ